MFCIGLRDKSSPFLGFYISIKGYILIQKGAHDKLSNSSKDISYLYNNNHDCYLLWYTRVIIYIPSHAYCNGTAKYMSKDFYVNDVWLIDVDCDMWHVNISDVLNNICIFFISFRFPKLELYRFLKLNVIYLYNFLILAI